MIVGRAMERYWGGAMKKGENTARENYGKINGSIQFRFQFQPAERERPGERKDGRFLRCTIPTRERIHSCGQNDSGCGSFGATNLEIDEERGESK